MAVSNEQQALALCGNVIYYIERQREECFCKGYICDKEKACHVFNVSDVY